MKKNISEICGSIDKFNIEITKEYHDGSINRYVDTDYSCVIGKKLKKKFFFGVDDPKKVIEFFNR